jgi:hypothetical protein
VDRIDPLNPRNARPIGWPGRHGAVQIIDDCNCLQQEPVCGEASFALALLRHASPKVREIGGGSLVRGDLLIALEGPQRQGVDLA